MLDCTQDTAPVKKLKRELGTVFFYAFSDFMPCLTEFEPVLGLYESKRGDQLMPTRRSIGFRDLKGWHASFMLLEFLPGQGEGYVRILGETYRTLFDGALWQGMPISQAANPDLLDLSHYFRELQKGPYIGRYQGALPHAGREHVYADIVDLPLTDDSGEPRYMMSFIREIRRPRA